MTNVRDAHLCVQGAESLPSNGNPMRIQVASGQASVAVAEGRKTESHAVPATKIHHRSRAQSFSLKQAEDSIQSQLPANKSPVESAGFGQMFDSQNEYAHGVQDCLAPLEEGSPR